MNEARWVKVQLIHPGKNYFLVNRYYLQKNELTRIYRTTYTHIPENLLDGHGSYMIHPLAAKHLRYGDCYPLSVQILGDWNAVEKLSSQNS